MSSIFTKIINRDIPAHILKETEDYIAFLDVNPLAKGHTLVVPKLEVDYIFDLEDEYFKGLWSFAKKVSSGIQSTVPCKRIGIAVIGLEVPHIHIHLIPINDVSDINFEREKLKFSQEELSLIASDIRISLQRKLN
ncbi:MAG: HIT family protein [Bacteroidetes bacterium]|nr:HIT family protein [Bacteroidota bacterium]